MWKCIVVAGLLSMAATYPASAAPGDASPPQVSQRAAAGDMVSKRLESMIRRLGLTAEQQAAMKTALQGQDAKLKELRADSTMAPSDKRAKIAELREKSEKEIRSILTPEQQAKQDEWLKTAIERRKNKK